MFFLSLLWTFYSFSLYSLPPIDGTATKIVLRFMSLETGRPGRYAPAGQGT